jgi:hypothetical protein
MIVILKRDDLPPEHSNHTIKDLELSQSGLSEDFIEKAELIVFMEGSHIKFLKNFPELQSKDSLDVFLRYVMSTAPTRSEDMFLGKKHPKRWKKSELSSH